MCFSNWLLDKAQTYIELVECNRAPIIPLYLANICPNCDMAEFLRFISHDEEVAVYKLHDKYLRAIIFCSGMAFAQNEK
jgi:hypothetical protein